MFSLSLGLKFIPIAVLARALPFIKWQHRLIWQAALEFLPPWHMEGSNHDETWLAMTSSRIEGALLRTSWCGYLHVLRPRARDWRNALSVQFRNGDAIPQRGKPRKEKRSQMCDVFFMIYVITLREQLDVGVYPLWGGRPVARDWREVTRN